MTDEFAGKIELDVRDSLPDWTPFLAPSAPEGAPNVMFIVWDDVGYGTMDCFGGPVRTPTMSRIAARGVKYSNFHTTALCSPTRASLLTGRNATSNGMATIAEFSSGFPGISTRIPFENGFISEVLAQHGYNTYCVGKWHLTPGEETSMAAWKRRWPLGRGFERFYGFLGGESSCWYPDLVHDNHPTEPPATPQEGRPDGWTSSSRAWASRPCRSRRSRKWPRNSTATWRSSARAGSTTPAHSRSWPLTRWSSRSVRAAGWCRSMRWWPPASTPTGSGRSSASRSPRLRTARAGWASSAT